MLANEPPLDVAGKPSSAKAPRPTPATDHERQHPHAASLSSPLPLAFTPGLQRPGDENNNANPSSSHHHSSAPTRSSRLASSSYSSSNAGTEVRMPGFHAEANNCHPGMTCDKSGMCPIIGIRYHLLGEDYDLCQEEYDKLTEAEKADYEAIEPPVFDAKYLMQRMMPPPARRGGGLQHHNVERQDSLASNASTCSSPAPGSAAHGKKPQGYTAATKLRKVSMFLRGSGRQRLPRPKPVADASPAPQRPPASSPAAASSSSSGGLMPARAPATAPPPPPLAAPPSFNNKRPRSAIEPSNNANSSSTERKQQHASSERSMTQALIDAGWKKVMDFGKLKGYRPPNGGALRSLAKAWREHNGDESESPLLGGSSSRLAQSKSLQKVPTEERRLTTTVPPQKPPSAAPPPPPPATPIVALPGQVIDTPDLPFPFVPSIGARESLTCVGPSASKRIRVSEALASQVSALEALRAKQSELREGIESALSRELAPNLGGAYGVVYPQFTSIAELGQAVNAAPRLASAALNAHALLRPVTVLRTTDGARVGLTDQWGADERAVLVLMRSFG